MSTNQENQLDLVRDLTRDPIGFRKAGGSYRLLQACFNGFPIDVLGNLLGSNDLIVVKIAMWVTSELGPAALPILDRVKPLLTNEDRFVRYNALEVVAATASNIETYTSAFVRALGDSDERVRLNAMQMLKRTSSERWSSVKAVICGTVEANYAPYDDKVKAVEVFRTTPISEDAVADLLQSEDGDVGKFVDRNNREDVRPRNR